MFNISLTWPAHVGHTTIAVSFPFGIPFGTKRGTQIGTKRGLKRGPIWDPFWDPFGSPNRVKLGQKSILKRSSFKKVDVHETLENIIQKPLFGLQDGPKMAPNSFPKPQLAPRPRNWARKPSTWPQDTPNCPLKTNFFAP